MFMYKQSETYLKKHAYYNAIIHVITGIGLGILLTYPLVGNHPVRWGLAFLLAGFLGHLYPVFLKKK